MTSNLLAQYEGAVTQGQVLGESASNTHGMIPGWLLFLIIFLIVFFIIFFAWKKSQKEEKKK